MTEERELESLKNFISNKNISDMNKEEIVAEIKDCVMQKLYELKENKKAGKAVFGVLSEKDFEETRDRILNNKNKK